MSGDYNSSGKYMNSGDGDPLEKVYKIIEEVRKAESAIEEMVKGLDRGGKLNKLKSLRESQEARIIRSGRYSLRQILLTGEQALDLVKRYYIQRK